MCRIGMVGRNVSMFDPSHYHTVVIPFLNGEFVDMR